jgi:peptidoglycan/LPS O-acetylase OafA/YrhL
MEEKKERRGDIDGLRGVAVLTIVLFHMFPSFIPGGFVGVDVFFVISGFVVTTSLQKDYEKQRTCSFLRNFYMKRIRRILPAAGICIFLALFGSSLLCLDADFIKHCQTAIASGLSVVNFYFCFMVPTGYFDQDSATNPLLHMWSLSVEEQFYLVWPFVFIVVVWKPLFVVLAASSFIFGQFVTDRNIAYFMLPARFGELLIGACLVIWHIKIKSEFLKIIFCLGGAVLLIGCLVLFNEGSHFPGLLALFPCVGTSLIIIGSRSKISRTHQMLSFWPMRSLGIMSYSVYLYHWPIIAFLRYHSISLRINYFGVCIFGGIMVLGALSYMLVERPFGIINIKDGTTVLLIVLFTLSLSVLAPAILVSRIKQQDVQKASILVIQNTSISKTILDKYPEAKYWDDYTLFVYKIVEVGAFPVVKNGCNPTVLFGDSHAAAFGPAISELSRLGHFSFVGHWAISCPPITGDLFAKGVHPLLKGFAQSCPEFQNKVIDYVLSMGHYGNVIMSARWSAYKMLMNKEFYNAVDVTLKKFSSANVTVLLIGEVPVFPGLRAACGREYVIGRMPDLCAITKSVWWEQGRPESFENELMDFSRKYKGVHYLNLHQFLCPLGICSPYFKGIRAYNDFQHLNMVGATLLGQEIFEKYGLPQSLAEIAKRSCPSNVLLRGPTKIKGCETINC